MGIAEIVGWSSAGRTRTAATAGPRRLSDGKLGGLLRPTQMLYGEAELTESSGSVSMTMGEAVSRGTRKGKVVWPGVLSPATDGRSMLTVTDR